MGFPNPLLAQCNNWEWISSAGGSAQEGAFSGAVDAAGNVYVTGVYRQTAVFDAITLQGDNAGEIFLACYNACGFSDWAIDFKGTGFDQGMSVAVAPDGNIVLFARFSEKINVGDITYVAEGVLDMLIIKIDPNGNILWSLPIGGIGNDWPNEIAVQENGDILITGSYGADILFGNQTLIIAGLPDLFLAKLDANGNFLWATSANGLGTEIGYDLDTDVDGNIYLTGYFDNGASFDNQTLASVGGVDIFLGKYDADGNLLWIKQAGGSGFDQSLGLDYDPILNRVYITGSYEEDMQFENMNLPLIDSREVFLAAYQADGNLDWVKSGIGTGEFDIGVDVIAHPDGTVYVGGQFNSSLDFDGEILTSNGLRDFFLAQFNNDGSINCAHSFGGSGQEQMGNLMMDLAGNIYVNGYFSQTISDNNINITSAGGIDIFIGKLGDASNDIFQSDTTLCIGDTLILDVTAPNATYLWQDGSTEPTFNISEAGLYWVEITQGDCMLSTSEIEVSFQPPPIFDLGKDTMICEDLSLLLGIFVLEADFTWQDGSTENTFEVQEPGIYTATATINSCSYTDSIEISNRDCACILEIPTAFSPNSDDVNETFRPIGECEMAEYHFQIFNRWGELVYETNFLEEAWDGRYKGKPAASDVFVWLLEYRNANETEPTFLKGEVLLLR